MLSSIHPLGERGRNNRWWITVTAFALAATVTAAVMGLTLGYLGSITLGGVDHSILIFVTAATAVVGGLLDMARVSPPRSERQVNESWIGHYRGWVYGGSFGFELGTGVMTYLVTWGVYVIFVAEFAIADPTLGAVVGAIFGFGRSIALLAAGWIDRPSRLTRFHELMAEMGPGVARLSAVSTAALGTIVGTAALI